MDLISSNNRKAKSSNFFANVSNAFSGFILPTKVEAATDYNWFRKTLIGENIYGVDLFEFWTQNLWYYDGVKILSISPKEGYKIYSSGWSYIGKSVEAWYEYNNFDYIRNVEGNFELNIVMRWQKATVFHDTKIRAVGTWSAVSDIQWSWTN